MSEQNPSAQAAPRRRSVFAALAGAMFVVALVAGGIAIYRLLQAAATVESQTVLLLVAGGCGAISALVGFIRSMSLWDLLEAAVSAVFGVFWLIGAILKGIWDAILGLFGWN